MTRQGHCCNRPVSPNMVTRVGSCDAGTTVPQKKEPGHAFQPVQFLPLDPLYGAAFAPSPGNFTFFPFLSIV